MGGGCGSCTGTAAQAGQQFAKKERQVTSPRQPQPLEARFLLRRLRLQPEACAVEPRSHDTSSSRKKQTIGGQSANEGPLPAGQRSLGKLIVAWDSEAKLIKAPSAKQFRVVKPSSYRPTDPRVTRTRAISCSCTQAHIVPILFLTLGIQTRAGQSRPARSARLDEASSSWTRLESTAVPLRSNICLGPVGFGRCRAGGKLRQTAFRQETRILMKRTRAQNEASFDKGWHTRTSDSPTAKKPCRSNQSCAKLTHIRRKACTVNFAPKATGFFTKCLRSGNHDSLQKS